VNVAFAWFKALAKLMLPFEETTLDCVDPKVTVCVKAEPERTPVRIAVGVGVVASVDPEVVLASPFSRAPGTDVKMVSPATMKSAGPKNV
jgi:hypothetical protein